MREGRVENDSNFTFTPIRLISVQKVRWAVGTMRFHGYCATRRCNILTSPEWPTRPSVRVAKTILGRR